MSVESTLNQIEMTFKFFDRFLRKSESLLHILVFNKEYQKLEECLKSKELDVNKGIDLPLNQNEDSFGNWTALHVSALVNDPKSAQILLKYGTKMEARTGSWGQNSFTALHIALIKDNEEVSKFLIHSKADINAKDSFMTTPIELCTHNPSLTRLLIEKGADYNSDHFRDNPLIFRAIEAKNEKLVQFLVKQTLKRGVYLRNKSPIEYAFEIFPDCVHHLIDSGIQIHFEDRETGEYPIHVAVRMNRYVWVEKLCAHKCNTNVANKNRDRPLHIAAQNDCSKQMSLLLMSCGANPNLKNDFGLTPLSVAIERGNEELTQLFIDMGIHFSWNLAELERAIRYKKFKVALLLFQCIKTIDNRIRFDSEPIIWFFVRFCVGEQESDASVMTEIMEKLIDMTCDVNSIDSVWGSLMHFLIYADVCAPTPSLQPMFNTLIRSLKCDINYEFKPQTTRKNGEEIAVERIVANGTALSFALQMTDCEHYAEQLIKVGANHSNINWDLIFFAPKKARALKMLIYSGALIPDSFREESDPCYDESVSEDNFKHFCEEFHRFIKWWDKRLETPLTLKQSARKIIRRSMGSPGLQQLATIGPKVFCPQFDTFLKILCDYILYDSYEDFEDF